VSPNECVSLFLERVCSHLFWPLHRARVRRELTDHILSRAEYLQNERGFSAEEAIMQAVCMMGDPDALGHALRQAHRPLCRLAPPLLLFLLCAGIACRLVYLFLAS
jgi:hypothetical protein